MTFKKEIEVEIHVDGSPLQGKSFIIVENGKVDYSQAEEHFYEIIRKWEKDWIKEANEEEKSSIVDNLTKEDEGKLQDKHIEDCPQTLDDDMEESFELWLEELELDTLKETLNPKVDTPHLSEVVDLAADDSTFKSNN